MGKGPRHVPRQRVNGKVPDVGLQLQFHVEFKSDPTGRVWLGLTFGQGTMSATLAIPADQREAFADMVTGGIREAYAQYESQAVASNLLVPKSGLILPNQS